MTTLRPNTSPLDITVRNGIGNGIELGRCGRADEVDIVIAALRAGTSLVVQGEPGIGKTSLLRMVSQHLQRDGWHVELVRARPATSSLAFAPFAQIDLGGLPSPHCDEHLVRLSNAIRQHADGGRFALLVDDAHALDPMSVELVSGLVCDGFTRVVCASRLDPGLPVKLEALRCTGHLGTVTLDALARSATDALIRSHLGGEIHETLAEEIWRLSGGHPLLTIELLNAGRERNAISRRGPVWHLTGHPGTSVPLNEVIDTRLRAVGPGAWELLAALAVAGDLPLDVLGSNDREHLAQLEAAGLATLMEEPLRMVVRVAHELYAEVILSGSDLAVHDARARAIDLLECDWPGREPDDLIRAALLRMETRRFDADRLMVAARLCLERFEAATALRLAERVLAAEPTVPTRLLYAAALSGCGRYPEADSEFRALAEEVFDPTTRAQVVIEHAYNAMIRQGDFDSAVAMLTGALRDGPDDATLDARALLTMVLTYSGDYSAALRVGSPLLQSSERVPLAGAQALAACLNVSGRATEAMRVWRRAVEPEWTERDAMPGDAVVNLTFLRLVARWQLGLGREDAHPMAWASRRSHPVLTAPLVRDAMRATAHTLRGQVGPAAEIYLRLGAAMSALPGPYHAFHQILAAWCHASLGDVAHAEMALELVQQTAPEIRSGFEFWHGRARAALLAACGDVDGAIERSFELADRHTAERFHASVALHDVARYGAADKVAATLSEWAAGPGATWWMQACADHARASATCDPELLSGVAMTFIDGGLDLYALEAASQSATLMEGRVTRPCVESDRARISELFQRCGDVRTPAVLPSPPHLTVRELEVARLAAAGAPNKEIALRLGTSVRTVGNQLQSVYTKLGIRGRSGLDGLI